MMIIHMWDTSTLPCCSMLSDDVVILFGVGHKAKIFDLENKIVFGSYRKWRSPGGSVEVSKLQKSLMKKLPERSIRCT